MRERYPINVWDEIKYDAPHPVPCWERRRRATVLSIDPTNSNSSILDTTTNECIPNGHLVKKIGTIVNGVTVPFDGIFMPLEWHILTHQTNPDGVTGGTCVAKKLQGAFGAARKLVAKKAAKQGTAQLPVDMQPFCLSIGDDWQNSDGYSSDEEDDNKWDSVLESDESSIDRLIQKLNSMPTSKITMTEVREKYNEICREKPQYTRHIDKSNPPSNPDVIVEDINILRDENMRTNKDDMSRSGSCSSGEWSRKLGLGSNTSSTCAGDPYLTTFHSSTTKEGQIHPNHPHTYLINNSSRDHPIHVQGNDSLSTFSFTSEGGQASEQLAATVVSGLHLTAAASSEPSMDAAPSTTQISAWERKTKGVVGGGESPEKMNAPSTMTEPGAAEESSKMSSAVVTAPEATLVAASLEALAAGAKGTSRVMAPSLAVQEVAATPTMTVMTTTTSTGMAMVTTTTTGRVMIPSMTNEGPATHFCAESNMDGYQMWNSSSA